MKRFGSLFILLLMASFVFAQNPGSKSLLHTHTGRTFEQGRLEVRTNLNFFTKLGEFIGQSKPSDFSAANYWMVANNLAITYGLFDNLDLTVAARLYQDTHYKEEFNVPDDIFVTLKAGSFDFANRQLYAAGMINLRFGTGEKHNYPFVEYASGSTEYGLMGALSFYLDPYLPARSFSTHLNLGWYTHNDASQEVYEVNGTVRTARFNATEMQFGLGFVYPVGALDFMLEVNGINYIEQPDTMIYSRENYIYITPSIRYKPYHWVSMDIGVDLRISGDEEETSGVLVLFTENLDLPNYSNWKAYLGLNFTILPLGQSALTPEEVERDRFNKRIDFFQNIIEERERVENVQEELDRLRREREEAEKELEELKQVLEEEG
jgi:hypothetical protein